MEEKVKCGSNYQTYKYALHVMMYMEKTKGSIDCDLVLNDKKGGYNA